MAKDNRTTSPRPAPRVAKATKARPPISRDRVFTALDLIESALVDAEGTAILIDQAVTQGGDDPERCVDHLSRHLSRDMAELRRFASIGHRCRVT